MQYNIIIYNKITGKVKQALIRNQYLPELVESLDYDKNKYSTLTVVGDLKPNDFNNAIIKNNKIVKETELLKSQFFKVKKKGQREKQGLLRLLLVGDDIRWNTGFALQLRLLGAHMSKKNCEVSYLTWDNIHDLVEYDFDFVISLSDYSTALPMFSFKLNNWLHWFACESTEWPEKWDNNLRKIPYLVSTNQFCVPIFRDKFSEQTVHHVPHCVDFDTFKPLSLRERSAIKKQNNCYGKFTISTVSMNYARKRFDLLLKSYAKFLRNTDCKQDSVLLIKTKMNGHYNISELIRQIGEEYQIQDFDQYIKVTEEEMSESELCEWINMADLGISCTSGEGFNVPVIEYLACGVPFLVGNHTTGPELIGETGPLIDVLKTEIDMRGDWKRFIIDTDICAELIEAYYDKWLNHEIIDRIALRNTVTGRYGVQQTMDRWYYLLTQLQERQNLITHREQKPVRVDNVEQSHTWLEL